MPAPRKTPTISHGNTPSIEINEPVDRRNQAKFKKHNKSATEPENTNHPHQPIMSPPIMSPCPLFFFQSDQPLSVFQQQQQQLLMQQQRQQQLQQQHLQLFTQMNQGVFQPALSRATMYRNRKKEQTITSDEPKKRKARKVYTCQHCNRPAGDCNHSQVYGKKYNILKYELGTLLLP